MHMVMNFYVMETLIVKDLKVWHIKALLIASVHELSVHDSEYLSIFIHKKVITIKLVL